jgi:hypothetical protein
MAWSDRPWILEGAAVRVSMVGFDNGSEKERKLNGEKVTSINADLTKTFDLGPAGTFAQKVTLWRVHRG